MSRLVVHRDHLEAIEQHATFCWPNEACGLLAGADDGTVKLTYCLTNIDDSPYRFTLDPGEHFAAVRHAATHGWEIIGSFHSHPHSAPLPSPTDVNGALDSSWVYLVTGPVEPGPLVTRAFRIATGVITEIDIEVAPLSERIA